MKNDQINIRINTPRHRKPRETWAKRFVDWLGLGVEPVSISVPAENIKRLRVVRDSEDEALAKAVGLLGGHEHVTGGEQ